MQCKGCGASFDGNVCTHCGRRGAIQSVTCNVPIRDVMIDTLRYDELLHEVRYTRRRGMTTGRITTSRILEGVSFLTRTLYDKGIQAREFRYHLVIPPELYPHILFILESDKVAELSTNGKNIAGRLLETVWIDPRIAATPPNCPWFLFADGKYLTDEDLDIRESDVFCSPGTSP